MLTAQPGSGADEGLVETLVYDGGSGELIGYTRALPRLADVRGDRAMAFRELPFPTVSVLGVRWPPRG